MFMTGIVMPAPIEVTAAALMSALSSHVEKEKMRCLKYEKMGLQAAAYRILTIKSLTAVLYSGFSRRGFFPALLAEDGGSGGGAGDSGMGCSPPDANFSPIFPTSWSQGSV